MPQNNDHYAIVIGIDEYPKLLRLRSSVNDATKFAEWLASPEGGNLPTAPPNHIQLITSPGTLPARWFDARPLKHEIDAALAEFGVVEGKRIGKRLYFYFAGHGFGPRFDEVGMLMANASMEYLTSNYGLARCRDYFHETRFFDEVIYILDCCRDPSRGIETSGPGFEIKRALNGVQRVNEFIVLGAQYGEKAFAPVSQATGERRGALTQAILEALQGEPRAVDAEGRITASSIREYVRDRIKVLATDEKLKQTPDIVLPEPEIVFRQDPKLLKRIIVHIVAPEEIVGELVLRHGTTRDEIGRRDANKARANNPWAVQLVANSRYEIENPASDRAVILDPTKAKEEPYVYHFPRP